MYFAIIFFNNSIFRKSNFFKYFQYFALQTPYIFEPNEQNLFFKILPFWLLLLNRHFKLKSVFLIVMDLIWYITVWILAGKPYYFQARTSKLSIKHVFNLIILETLSFVLKMRTSGQPIPYTLMGGGQGLRGTSSSDQSACLDSWMRWWFRYFCTRLD